ncbi:MAG: hypothetical protein M3N47_14270 [Chloroflexota bacterium]|nr:hypothetical protein [Chloroflexota bacterium]
MSTHATHWTIPAGSTGRHWQDASRRARAASVLALPVAVWPLVGTVAVTELSMLAVIFWASPDLETGALVAAVDVPVVLPLIGLMCWLLLMGHQGRARAHERE